MKKTLYFFITLLVISCQSNDSSNETDWNDGDNWNDRSTYSEPEPEPQLSEAELHRQLEKKECQAPGEYIDGTVSYKPIYKNVLSSKVKGLKLTFDLFSIATIASFQDVHITVQLQSKTGSTIKSEDLTVYEYIHPGGSVKYKYEMAISNQQYKDFYEVVWYIRYAECVNN